MTQSIDFLYDFGSPNVYFCHRVLPGIAARTGVTVNYIPCLLGGIFKATGNVAPALAFGKVQGKLEYERLEIDRFVRKHALTDYRWNRHFPVNTVLQMRGAVAAEMDGYHDAYIEACMAAMWEKDLKMDDPEVFVTALNDAGLDGAHVLERTQDQAVKDALFANTNAAVERRVFGMPTFFVGDEMFFGKERLGQLEDEINRQRDAG
ncbi:MAG: 2-hydroxychromene-2-carboxylate isomerase [Silicimonas sp.]|nr:2-hydroxychromene-2-carboxylate isomerase [Silicimonas sp.]